MKRSFDSARWAWAQSLARCARVDVGGDIRVALVMLAHAKEEVFQGGGPLCCDAEVAALIEDTGIPERSVQRARQRLCAAGVLQKVGTNRDTLYVFRPFTGEA